MKKQRWNKKPLIEAYPIGTPVAFCLSYPSSNVMTQFGRITGYTNEYYRGTWCIIYERFDGEQFHSVPIIPGRTKATGWVGIVSEERLSQLESQLPKTYTRP